MYQLSYPLGPSPCKSQRFKNGSIATPMDSPCEGLDILIFWWVIFPKIGLIKSHMVVEQMYIFCIHIWFMIIYTYMCVCIFMNILLAYWLGTKNFDWYKCGSHPTQSTGWNFGRTSWRPKPSRVDFGVFLATKVRRGLGRNQQTIRILT